MCSITHTLRWMTHSQFVYALSSRHTNIYIVSVIAILLLIIYYEHFFVCRLLLLFAHRLSISHRRCRHILTASWFLVADCVMKIANRVFSSMCFYFFCHVYCSYYIVFLLLTFCVTILYNAFHIDRHRTTATHHMIFANRQQQTQKKHQFINRMKWKVALHVSWLCVCVFVIWWYDKILGIIIIENDGQNNNDCLGIFRRCAAARITRFPRILRSNIDNDQKAPKLKTTNNNNSHSHIWCIYIYTRVLSI